MVLETPQKRSNKPDKKARLKLIGKALGPNPYDIDVLVEHINDQDAHFSGTIAGGPKGNNLQCLAKLHFSSPLPTSLNCSANFRQTKELTDRLKLFDIPSVTLSEPLVVNATQIAVNQNAINQKAVNQKATTPNTVNPDKNTARLVPAQGDVAARLSNITEARYRIQVTLPPHVKVALNRFAFQHPMLSGTPDNKTAISTLSFKTDGTLTFEALYQDDKLVLELSEPPLKK